MTKGTRYFLAGAALVLVAGLCTGLVAYYNGNLAIGASSPAATELAYLPADTSAVAYANVQEIMGSQFRQKLRQVLPTGQEKDKLLAETGIDLERDIESVVAGFSGDDMSPMGAIVLVRGRFNEAHIEALAVQHGARVEEYKKKRLILSKELPATHTGQSVRGEGEAVKVIRHEGGLAFLEPGLLAIGDSSAIRRAIDTSQSRENVTKNADLMRFVNDAQGGSNAWVVGRFDAFAKHAGPSLPEAAKNQLNAVQWFAVSARVNGGISGVIRAEAKDVESAKNLRDAANGFLALGKMMSSKESKLEQFVNSLQLQGTDKTVTLAFTLPPEFIDIINGAAGLEKVIKK